MFCSGCGVPEGTGHSLGCSYGGGWYTTRAESSAGSGSFSYATVADTSLSGLYHDPCPECGEILNHDIFCSLSPIRNNMCHLHISSLPCPFCAEATAQAFRDRCLSDFQKRVQEKINALYPEQPNHQEEPLADNIDRTLLAKLEAMRAARDEAVRYAQTLNDEAALHRIEDERLTAQASRIIDQVNEGTPIPEDS